jgi:anti-sigma factor RsiW
MTDRIAFNCQQIVELVTEYLDDALSPAERLAFERHVMICPPCRGYLAQLRTIRKTAGTLREEDLPAPLREGLVHAFRNWKAQRP